MIAARVPVAWILTVSQILNTAGVDGLPELRESRCSALCRLPSSSPGAGIRDPAAEEHFEARSDGLSRRVPDGLGRGRRVT